MSPLKGPAERWELQYRLAGLSQPWTPAPLFPGDADELVVPGLDLDQDYDFRLRVVNGDGKTSAWVEQLAHRVEAADEPPPAPVHVSSPDGDCITWQMPETPRDVAGFEIRTNPGHDEHWEHAEPAHAGLWPGPPFPGCLLPSGTRTILVAAVDPLGQKSEPVAFVGALKPLLLEEDVGLKEWDYSALGWPGVIRGGHVDGTQLVAEAMPGALFWPIADCRYWRGDDAAPFWGTDEAPHWVGGDDGRPFWGEQAAGLFWGGRYQDLVFEWDQPVPSGVGGATTVLGIEPSVNGKGWRLEMRPDSQLFWAPVGDDVFWPLDDEEYFWGSDADLPWVPWPGGLHAVQPAAMHFRLWVPGGAQSPVVTGLLVKASRPS